MPRKSPTETPSAPEPGELVKPPHGNGLLRHGSQPGTNKGGPGRPKNEIRERLAGVVDEYGVDYVARVMRGEEDGATIQDRLAAFDKAAKYGLGTVKEVSVEHVRERLKETIRIIGEELPQDIAEKILRRLQPVWKV